MRVMFAGTPEFAVPVLDAVVQAGHQVVLVCCQPDRPAGRGHHMTSPPVKRRALELALPVFQPQRLREPTERAPLLAVQADVMLVVAYGLILPQAVLDAPRFGCINVHASLLPRWRGAAPIQRAIEAGDRQTGITIMRMDAGLDTGPMLLGEALPIEPQETGGSLHDRLSRLGARLAVQALEGLARGVLQPHAQPEQGVTYARKIEREEGVLDFRDSAQQLADRIRAFDPFPGTSAVLERGSAPALSIKIWRARALDVLDGQVSHAPGTIVGVGPLGVRVACGQGELELLEVQRPGARRQSVAQVLRGLPIAPGDRLVGRA